MVTNGLHAQCSLPFSTLPFTDSEESKNKTPGVNITWIQTAYNNSREQQLHEARRELIFCNESDCTLYRVYLLPPSSTLRHFIIPQRSLTFTPSELQPRHFLSDAGGNQPCLSTWARPSLPNNTNTPNKQGWLKFRQYHTGDTDHTVHLIFEWTKWFMSLLA